MPDLLPDKLTPISKPEALNALYAGWVSLFGAPPDNEDSLRVLMSQWALETGWGKAMHNFNFGNVKSVAGDGYDYCMFRCYEKVNGQTVWYDPPNPATRFRAFKSAAEGAADYLKILHKRFNLSWPSVLSGDPAKFSHALRQQGYYTADESQYTSTMKGIFGGLKGAKIDKSAAPPPAKKSDGGDAPPKPAATATKNVIDGVGAAGARVALTRALSVSGWTLDGGAAWKLDDKLQAPETFHAVKLLPGDTINVVTSVGPRCGRVGTVIIANGEYCDSGTVWIATAAGPNQEVMIELLSLEATPSGFDASLKAEGKPVLEWREGEQRPSLGHAWVVGLERTSQVQRGRVDKMSDGQRTKLKLKKGEIEVTPGTTVSRFAKQHAGDPTVGDVPPGDDGKVPEKQGPANASGGGLPPGPLSNQPPDKIPPPIQIDAHTVQVHIGTHSGRVGFTLKRPGAPKPTSPDSGTPKPPAADGKRDAFIQAAMNLVGTPYLANSSDPAKGLDGVALVSIALKRVGVVKKDAPALTAAGLGAMFHIHGASATKVPDDIRPGDLAWFGQGTHDVPAQQHPMIFLGGGKVLGPIPDAGPKGGAVQVVAISKVPEHFAGWAHIEDLGADTEHTEHPGEPPPSGVHNSAAVLPAGPAAAYDALKKLAADKKSPWLDAKGQVNLIGVKNLHDRAIILPKEDDWNDTVFAAYLDADGNKCCIELRASINPGTDKEHAGTWQLIDGGYKFKLADGDGLGIKTLQPDGEVQGWLDEHGAGVLTPGELKESAPPGKASAPPSDASGGDSGGDGGGSESSESESQEPAASTTAAPADSTTAAPAASTTAAPADSTTAAPAASTTAAPADSTTAAPAASTTAAPADSTTAAPAASTTAAPADSTTAAPAASTTAAPAASTTAAPAASTTAAPAASTTAAPAASTTAAPAASTTAAPATTTTAAPAGTTTAAAQTTTTAAPSTTTTAAPTTTTVAPNSDKVSSSNITVAGQHFVDWFNTVLKPQYPGNHPTIQLWKKPAPMFPSKVDKTHFCTVFDNVKYLWAEQLTVPEFLGFFGIFYNETGGSMQPMGEVGGAKYMFEPTPGGKASYNKSPNRLAGDQLKAMGLISDPADVAAWNGTTYPANAPANVLAAAKECDFYKYRGHGFIQTTWRNNYHRDCDPALKAAGYSKTCDDMTTEELENAIKTDPKVNLPMVKSFFKNMGSQFAKVNQDPPVWYDTGRAVSGQKPYGDLYQWRCETIFAAMKKAGFELK